MLYFERNKALGFGGVLYEADGFTDIWNVSIDFIYSNRSMLSAAKHVKNIVFTSVRTFIYAVLGFSSIYFFAICRLIRCYIYPDIIDISW